MPTAEARLLACRRASRDAFIHALARSGRLRAARGRLARRGAIVVLTLHRIVPDARLALCRSPHGMVLRESLFAQLVTWLAAHVAPHDPLDTLRPGPPAASLRVLLTFDDGWLDNSTVALPWLRQAGIRACFFVSTALVGCRHPFWPERAAALLRTAAHTGQLPRLRSLLPALDPTLHPSALHHEEHFLTLLKQYRPAHIAAWLDDVEPRLCTPPAQPDPEEQLMSWRQLRHLAETGHRVASHTASHAILPSLGPHELASELTASRDMLRAQLPRHGAHDPWLSYPDGAASPRVLAAAHHAGYHRAFGTHCGVIDSSAHPRLLPRVNIWSGTLTDAHGNFSPIHLEYALFWRTLRAAAHP